MGIDDIYLSFSPLREYMMDISHQVEKEELTRGVREGTARGRGRKPRGRGAMEEKQFGRRNG